MRPLLALLLLFFFFEKAYCDEPSRQAALKELQNASSDTARINALNSLGREYIIGNEYILADSVLQIALQEAREKAYSKGEMSILINIGVLYWYQDKYPQALEHYFRSLK